MPNDAVIISATRTPLGQFQGILQPYSATELGARAIESVVKMAGLPLDHVNEVLMGCVLSAGLGQAPARQAALKAGLSKEANCTTINKICGSGMKSVMLATGSLLADPEQCIVAGGMESMSNAPYLLPKARQGYRMGHQRAVDHMFYDGLEDAYESGSLMGVFADRCAASGGFSREEQDEYTLASLERAKKATEAGVFAQEITAVDEHATDEGVLTANATKIPTLKPAFSETGTITAANASSISDGAAALVILSEQHAQAHKLSPIARIKAYSSYAGAPDQFSTAPVGAIQALLAKTGWQVDDVDCFEINEAFAVVVLHTMKALNIPHDKVNILGGACVLGHPIGASGARIIVTLLNALKTQQKKTRYCQHLHRRGRSDCNRH